MMPRYATVEMPAYAASRGTGWSLPGTKLSVADGDPVTNTLAAGATSSQLQPGTWKYDLNGTLMALTHGREVPTVAIIRGIEVKVRRKGVGIVDNTIQLYSNFSPVGNNMADTSTEWGSDYSTITYGGPNDTLGTNLTGFVSNQYFLQLRIRAKNTGAVSSVASVDYVSIKIYYQCYIFNTVGGGYLTFQSDFGGTVPYTHTATTTTGDDLSALNTSSTENALDVPMMFFDTANVLVRKRILAAEYGANYNTIVDFSPSGSSGVWYHYINQAEGATIGGEDISPWNTLGGSDGAMFWSTAEEPFTDGAGYYAYNLSAYLDRINILPYVNGGYTNVVIRTTNDGAAGFSESVYALLDSINKTDGFPPRLCVVTDEQDPLDAGCEINTVLAGS